MKFLPAQWSRCARKGHDWFPQNQYHREFIPVMSTCLRCNEKKVWLPWGQCLNGHPIAEHYDQDGTLLRRAMFVDGCTAPR